MATPGPGLRVTSTSVASSETVHRSATPPGPEATWTFPSVGGVASRLIEPETVLEIVVEGSLIEATVTVQE